MIEKFAKKLGQELKRGLPGFSAQKMMAPIGRRPFTDYLANSTFPKKSAVLILLYPDRSSLKTVLILRPDNEGDKHAGQISLPGGKYEESDSNLFETALRETEEEIGVSRDLVSLIGELTPLYIPISNYRVYPFIGISHMTPVFTIYPQEVKEVFEFNINDFSEINKSTITKYIKMRNAEMAVPCYSINGKIIWGATAMILSEFSEIIKRMK